VGAQYFQRAPDTGLNIDADRVGAQGVIAQDWPVVVEGEKEFAI